jgi:transposase InsO family protein
MYPSLPKEGVRASRPDEVWHVDVTIFKLLDGTRAYLHAVIDNFSRRVLAWRLTDRLLPGGTVAILLEAARTLAGGTVPTLFADSGSENVNGKVDALVEAGRRGSSSACWPRPRWSSAIRSSRPGGAR